MKPKIIYLVILTIVLCLSELNVRAQVYGCDLCGPATGTYKNNAAGNYSATIGAGCESLGQYSFAIGFLSKAYSPGTIAIGNNVKAQATSSIVIGSGVNNAISRMLTNNVPNSLMIGFNSCLPTLFVSNSSGYNTTGKVGIGNVTSPKAKLHIKSDNNEDAGLIIEPTNSSKMAYLQLFDENNIISVKPDVGLSITSYDSEINFDANRVMMNAEVVIDVTKEKNATTKSAYALSVVGGIMTTKVLVREVSDWHDYVFDDDYKLPSLNNVKNFIDKNGHLPDIPSEDNILKDGYDMVEMDGLLLKKIEELTLYTIELNELIKCQQEIIESLQSK